MFERILLSVDGRTDSEKALRATRELARLHGSEVFVVYSRESSALAAPVPSAPVATRQLIADTGDEARHALRSALAELRSEEVRARGEVLPRRGRVAQQVVEAARSTREDLIILGSRGMSQVWELVAGSPAQKVIRLAHCPVLVVR